MNPTFFIQFEGGLRRKKKFNSVTFSNEIQVPIFRGNRYIQSNPALVWGKFAVSLKISR
jgi:hypothetical protein